MEYYFFGFLLANINLTKSISRSIRIYRERKKFTITLVFHILSVLLGLLGFCHLFFSGLSVFCYAYLFKWESLRLYRIAIGDNLAAANYWGTYLGLYFVGIIICIFSLIGLIQEKLMAGLSMKLAKMLERILMRLPC